MFDLKPYGSSLVFLETAELETISVSCQKVSQGIILFQRTLSVLSQDKHVDVPLYVIKA